MREMNRWQVPAAMAALMWIAGGCSDSDGGSNNGGGSQDSGMQVDSGDGDRACEDGDMCDFECSDSCSVECIGEGTRCTAECPEGECTMDADRGATAAFSCEGGGCVTDCDGASDCTVDCPGGGCEVGCDGESTCKVLCESDGAPCEVFCEAGATATCEAGDCEVQGCEPCDETDIDESYMPSLDPADYSADIDNPLFPLKVGAKWVYEGDGEIITVEVLDETTTVAGIECRVVRDTVTDEDGVLIEDTFDWYAQDTDGNVWYMGEDTYEYVNGKKVNAHGAWETGVDGALPGIIVHGTTPEVGTVYKQEYLRCKAEDSAEIFATGESVETPAGNYDDCVRIREFSPIEPAANEHKLFCPGVGVAVVEDVEKGASSGEPVELLVEVSGL